MNTGEDEPSDAIQVDGGWPGWWPITWENFGEFQVGCAPSQKRFDENMMIDDASSMMYIDVMVCIFFLFSK